MAFKSNAQRKYLEAMAHGKQGSNFPSTPMAPKQASLQNPIVAPNPVSTGINPVKASVPQAPKPPKAPRFNLSPAGSSKFGKVKKMFGGY